MLARFINSSITAQFYAQVNYTIPSFGSVGVVISTLNYNQAYSFIFPANVTNVTIFLRMFSGSTTTGYDTHLLFNNSTVFNFIGDIITPYILIYPYS